jgi:uncharacterized protein YecT (DUF1311 family)
MKIKLTSVSVEDQDKALGFYTEVDAAHRRAWLDHRDAEGHLRQPASAHPAGTLFKLRRS